MEKKPGSYYCKIANTKLNESAIAKCYEYLDNFHPDNDNETDEVIPTLQGLATYIGVTYRTLLNWAKREDMDHQEDYVKFRGLLKDVYHTKLINRGLDRTYDGQIVKLLLGQDGIVDRSSVDTTSSDGSRAPIVVDTKVAQALADKLTD